MKKALVLLMALLPMLMMSCSQEATTTYDVTYFAFDMELVQREDQVISFKNNKGEIEQVGVTRKKVISDTKILYFTISFTSFDGITQPEQQAFFDSRNLSGYNTFFFLTDNPDPKPDTIKIATYNELCKIFKDYIESHPMPEVTTATTS